MIDEEEISHLELVKEKINSALLAINRRVTHSAQTLQQQKQYIWENKGEKNGMNDAMLQTAVSGEAVVAKRNRLFKLIASPYFGRIDFCEAGRAESSAVYIGVHNFSDENSHEQIVYDWRAPVASLFYDFELGEAYFSSPSGKIEGRIRLKRQYRIREGRMEFMLENSTQIKDSILQEELSRASDEKMKNIISTIQRDQNAIIRNEDSHVLIIQGVAGSGKSSIALHRIAYLLYRFKDSLSSKNILIISPNKVFADYISNILPELGEENIPEMGMDELAANTAGQGVKFQTFFEQVAILLAKNDRKFIERVECKASFEFIGQLEQYITFITNEYFKPAEISVYRYKVAADFIAARFEGFHRLPLLKRFPDLVNAVAEHLKIRHRYLVNAKERNEIRKSVTKMFRIFNTKELYKDFYRWLGKPEYLKMAPGLKLEYADVFPLIYLKMRLEGFKPYGQVKHLIIDEMQDYTPIQYAVMSRLFTCAKTILGDAGQSVNPYSSSDAGKLRKAFAGAEFVELNKSYRSTYEITRFAQRISANDKIEVVERHGEKPTITCLRNTEAEINEINGIIGIFKTSDYRSLGIICKTNEQAEALFEQLNGSKKHFNWLTENTKTFADGVIVTTAHLEFDQVVVPFVSADNYLTPIDRSMLYVACTRAMHRLDLTHCGALTAFLQ